MELLKTTWEEATFIAFDTETTGKYPIESELCEIAAVKWKAGEIIGEYSSLFKPSQPMTQEVIKIHNITNEMVENAPKISAKIHEFHEFIQDGFLIAHHAPFDLGFVAIELEKQGLAFPQNPVLCSSLISRRALPESENHKLQTLVKYLGVDGGQAHRALDDAKACLEVGLASFKKVGEGKSLQEILNFQQVKLTWDDYSIEQLKENQALSQIIKAIEEKKSVEMVYQGGSRSGQAREIKPVGIVRSPNGDFLVAFDGTQEHPKRYFLDKITQAKK